MYPYLVNPLDEDEYLVPKRDLKGNVVHYRRRRYARSEEEYDRFFLAVGVATAVMFGAMLVSWINTPL